MQQTLVRLGLQVRHRMMPRKLETQRVDDGADGADGVETAVEAEDDS